MRLDWQVPLQCFWFVTKTKFQDEAAALKAGPSFVEPDDEVDYDDDDDDAGDAGGPVLKRKRFGKNPDVDTRDQKDKTFFCCHIWQYQIFCEHW